jgi:hypothetical protein
VTACCGFLLFDLAASAESSIRSCSCNCDFVSTYLPIFNDMSTASSQAMSLSSFDNDNSNASMTNIHSAGSGSKYRSPSKVSNPTVALQKIQERLRSVLSHPFCIPLLCVMHNLKPDFAANKAALTFSGLLEETRDLVQESTKVLFNAVLQNSLRNVDDDANETTITKKIVETCNVIKDPNEHVIFFADDQIFLKNINGNTARPDIFFTDEDTTIKGYSTKFTPLMIIEVGMKGEEWWDKFDQCVQYLDMMSQLEENQLVTFDRPLLMSVITIDKDNTNGKLTKLKIGVFFCHPKRGKVSTRVVLLWHNVSTNIKDASISFGKVLEVTTHFQKLVNETTRDLSSELQYEYFTSNCCKTGNRVRDRNIR